MKKTLLNILRSGRFYTICLVDFSSGSYRGGGENLA